MDDVAYRLAKKVMFALGYRVFISVLIYQIAKRLK